jgi:hypothetical protein
MRPIFSRPTVSAFTVLTLLFAGLQSSVTVHAATTNKLVGAYFLLYNPDKPADTAEYVRLTLGNGAKADLDQFVENQTACIILRPSGKLIPPFLLVSVPMKLRLNDKRLYIDARIGNGVTFRPGDLVMFQVTIEPKDANGKPVNEGKFRPTAVQWRDGDGGVGAQSRVGSAKIAGFKFVTDPEYIAYNDLDSSVYTAGLGIDIKNLNFLSGQPESIFGISDENATVKGIFDASPNASLGSISLPTSGSAQPYINPFNEPQGDLFSVATGQLYDPDTGAKIGAFVEGVSAVPEPNAVALLSGGTIGLALLVVRRKRTTN